MVPVFHLLEEDSTKIVSDNAYTISVIDDYIVYLTVILFIWILKCCCLCLYFNII
jgi:hypothetical protein